MAYAHLTVRRAVTLPCALTMMPSEGPKWGMNIETVPARGRDGRRVGEPATDEPLKRTTSRVTVTNRARRRCRRRTAAQNNCGNGPAQVPRRWLA